MRGRRRSQAQGQRMAVCPGRGLLEAVWVLLGSTTTTGWLRAASCGLENPDLGCLANLHAAGTWRAPGWWPRGAGLVASTAGSAGLRLPHARH